MALKKTESGLGITVDPAIVDVTPPTENTPETSVETTPETQPVQTPESPADETTVPEVTIPETPTAPPSLEVTPAVAQETNIPQVEQKVRIRMARDHRCTIAMEHYDLKKGQCYLVSQNVKRILNGAGLLSPL